MKRAFAYSMLIFLLSTAPSIAAGAELPVWEGGLGLSTLSFPDYRGSAQNHYYAFPFPFFIYRGDVLKVDRNAVRSLFFRSDRIELDSSFSGSPPVRSDRNDARKGMPNLDPSLEAGPSVRYLLMRSPSGWKAEFQFPLRAVLVSDLSYIHYEGLVFNPRVSLDWYSGDRTRRWSAGSAVGPVFIDTRNSRYYYSVDPIYATPERPAYTANGGYAGMQFSLSAAYRARSLWIGAYLRGDSVRHASFEDSPLVKARSNIAAIIAISWVFGTSETLIESDD